jgi:hypothetical protein
VSEHDTSTDIRRLLDAGYEVTFQRWTAGPGGEYFANITSEHGARWKGLGATPGEALRSVWPLGYEHGQGGCGHCGGLGCTVDGCQVCAAYTGAPGNGVCGVCGYGACGEVCPVCGCGREGGRLACACPCAVGRVSPDTCPCCGASDEDKDDDSGQPVDVAPDPEVFKLVKENFFKGTPDATQDDWMGYCGLIGPAWVAAATDEREDGAQ